MRGEGGREDKEKRAKPLRVNWKDVDRKQLLCFHFTLPWSI